MTHRPISPEFRVLHGSLITYSDSSDDESWPRAHMPLAHQELPPPLAQPVYGSPLPARLCNRMLSSEIRRYFMPEDCPASERSWYTLDIDELLPQQLTHVTKVIEGMLETNFEGWDGDHTRTARASLDPAQLGLLLEATTAHGIHQVALKIIHCNLFQHIPSPHITTALTAAFNRTDQEQEASEVVAALLGKMLIAGARAGSVELVYELINESAYFNDISTEDLNRALSDATQQNNEGIIMVLIESSRFEDFTPACLIHVLRRAMTNHYDRVILTLLYSARAQELLANIPAPLTSTLREHSLQRVEANTHN